MATESVDGRSVSVRHTVTRDDKIIHQHQEHFGSSSSVRRFSDELTGVETIGSPPRVDTYSDLTKKIETTD